jgi:hypothetical protein
MSRSYSELRESGSKTLPYEKVYALRHHKVNTKDLPVAIVVIWLANAVTKPQMPLIQPNPRLAKVGNWVQLCGYAHGRQCMYMNQPKFARQVRGLPAAMFVGVPHGDT